MARGGKRNGAGRPKGAIGKKGDELLDLIDKHAGVSPGYVLLHIMWYWFGKGNEIRNAPALAATPEGQAQIDKWYEVACRAAKAAAPYVHPKLAPCYGDDDEGEEWRDQAGASDGPAQEPFPTDEQLKEMDLETLTRLCRDQLARS